MPIRPWEPVPGYPFERLWEEAARPVFDGPAVDAVVQETGLPLAVGMTRAELGDRLETAARGHYWNALEPNAESAFSGLADFPVTPSALRDRLLGIERAAQRVFAGTARRPLVEKAVLLLNRLGYDRKGDPLRYSGTEREGHGGSERSALWRCLVGSIQGTERPPRGYRASLAEGSWATTRFGNTILELVGYAAMDNGIEADAKEAARAVYGWAAWARGHVDGMLASGKDRHRGDAALDATLLQLAEVYTHAFGMKPSLYRRDGDRERGVPNVWGRFLQAALRPILAPAPVPPVSALLERWRHLAHPGT